MDNVKWLLLNRKIGFRMLYFANKFYLHALFFLLFFSLNSYAVSDALDNFFTQTHSLNAEFTQTILDNNGKTIANSNGQLIIKRPNQFILEYTQPDQQRYISDGKTLWVYDVDLEQVTIKAVDEQLLNSPALLLSSNKNIRDLYQIKKIAHTKSPHLDIYNLIAKEKNDDSSNMFSSIQLTFSKQQLMEIKMADNFDQETHLSLYNQKINPQISAEKFSFIIPFGVDVIGTRID
jgi:outer membrane lipoprotein carrier protein